MPLHSALQNVTGSVALSAAPQVFVVSGSVTGLLVGGQPLSSTNVLPVSVSGTFNVSAVGPETGATGSLAPVSGALAGFVDPNGNLMPSRVSAQGHQIVTGSVSLTEPVAISNFPAVQIVSASNWIPTVTGSVVVANQVNVTGSVGITAPVTVLQGTSPWIISGSSWIPTITGSVRVENIVQVTGSVVIGTRVDTRLLAMSATLIATPATASANVTLVGANPARAGLTIYNDAKKIVYVKFGVSASLTDYTMQMADDDYYEVPFGYTGRIDAFADAGATGDIRVTEIV